MPLQMVHAYLGGWIIKQVMSPQTYGRHITLIVIYYMLHDCSSYKYDVLAV